MNKEIKNANRCLEKLKERFLSAYYAGFNQAHYSHMHPDTFEVKECQSAGEEYMVKNEKYLISDLKEYASQFKQPDISEDVRKAAEKYLTDLGIANTGMFTSSYVKNI